MIFGAYCVGKAHNMLSSIIIIIGVYCVGRYTICYLGSMIMG